VVVVPLRPREPLLEVRPEPAEPLERVLVVARGATRKASLRKVSASLLRSGAAASATPLAEVAEIAEAALPDAPPAGEAATGSGLLAAAEAGLADDEGATVGTDLPAWVPEAGLAASIAGDGVAGDGVAVAVASATGASDLPSDLVSPRRGAVPRIVSEASRGASVIMCISPSTEAPS